MNFIFDDPIIHAINCTFTGFLIGTSRDRFLSSIHRHSQGPMLTADGGHNSLCKVGCLRFSLGRIKKKVGNALFPYIIRTYVEFIFYGSLNKKRMYEDNLDFQTLHTVRFSLFMKESRILRKVN